MVTIKASFLDKANDLRSQKEKEGQEIKKGEVEVANSNIQKLENQKQLLEIIQNSLNFKSDSSNKKESGTGMKEYRNQVMNEVSSSKVTLDSIIESADKDPELKSVLEEAGIKNTEDLVDKNPDADEVLDYKKSLLNKDGLKETNEALILKLQELGVVIPKEESSHDYFYTFLSNSINERLGKIENELIKEKVKIPEEREMIIENLSKELEKDITPVTFNIENEGQKIILYVKGLEIKVENDHVNIDNFVFAPELLSNDKEVMKTESVYGKDVLQETLKKFYSDKINESFEKNSVVLDLKKAKEGISSFSEEEKGKARSLMDKFEQVKREFIHELEKKHTELYKNFGVSVDIKKFEYGYRDGSASIDYILSFKPEDSFDKNKGLKFKENLESRDKFIPEFNYVKLQGVLEIRTQDLKANIDKLKNIKNENDFYLFGKNICEETVSINSSMHYGNEPYSLGGSYHKKSPNKDTSFDEEKLYVEDFIKKIEEDKEKVINKMKSVIDFYLAEVEFRDGIQKGEEIELRAVNLNQITSVIKEFESRGKQALEAIEELTKFESSVPADNDINFSRGLIRIPSIDKKIESLQSEIDQGKKDIRIYSVKKSDYELKKPKFFFTGKGKKEWEDVLFDFDTKLTEMTTNITNKEAELKKSSGTSVLKVPIPSISNSYGIEKFTKQNNVGNMKDILSGLYDELRIIQERKIPQSIIDLNNQYLRTKKELVG